MLFRSSGYDGYNEDVFIIEFDAATNKAKRGNWNGQVGKYYYNESLNNINVLNRWSYDFPNNVLGNIIDVDANRFLATLTQNIMGVTYSDQDSDGTTYTSASNARELGPILFDDDYSGIGEDPSNNYGNGTTQGNPISAINSVYTCPTDGSYSFNSQIQIIFKYNFTGTNPRKWRDKKIGRAHV